MRVVLTRAFDKTTSSTMAARYASVVASVINTIAIQIMNYLFQYVARFFNTWENHRTDVEHYNNLILKLISFNFCNYNIPLVYNAFFQRHLEGCPRGDGDIEPGKGTCYSALEMNLGIIFLTKWFSGLCMDLLIPYLEKKYKRHKHPELIADKRDGKHEAELQFDLAPTDGFEATASTSSSLFPGSTSFSNLSRTFRASFQAPRPRQAFKTPSKQAAWSRGPQNRAPCAIWTASFTSSNSSSHFANSPAAAAALHAARYVRKFGTTLSSKIIWPRTRSAFNQSPALAPVSYTHLTLPTKA